MITFGHKGTGLTRVALSSDVERSVATPACPGSISKKDHDHDENPLLPRIPHGIPATAFAWDDAVSYGEGVTGEIGLAAEQDAEAGELIGAQGGGSWGQ